MSHQASKRQAKAEEALRLPIQMVWADLRTCIAKTGFSRSSILRIIGKSENQVRHCIIRSDPANMSGKEYVHLPDLIAYFEREAEKALETRTNLEGAIR